MATTRERMLKQLEALEKLQEIKGGDLELPHQVKVLRERLNLTISKIVSLETDSLTTLPCYVNTRTNNIKALMV